MTVLPYPTPKISDADAFLIHEADEVVRAELDRAATSACSRLWEVGLLRGPGNQDVRERRIKAALLDLYYDLIVENARLDAAKARMKELDELVVSGPIVEPLAVSHGTTEEHTQ